MDLHWEFSYEWESEVVLEGVGLVPESLKAHKESKAAKKDKQAKPSTSRTSSKGRGNPDRKVDASEDRCFYEDMGVDTGRDLESEWNLDDAPDKVIDDLKNLKIIFSESIHRRITSGMRLQARHRFQWYTHRADKNIVPVFPSQHLRPYSRIVELTKIT